MKQIVLQMMGGKKKIIDNVVWHEFDVIANKLRYQQLVKVNNKYKDGKTKDSSVSLDNVRSFEVKYAAI